MLNYGQTRHRRADKRTDGVQYACGVLEEGPRNDSPNVINLASAAIHVLAVSASLTQLLND